MAAIRAAIDRLADQHELHIAHYGDGLERRLTGLHETCDIDTFRNWAANVLSEPSG